MSDTERESILRSALEGILDAIEEIGVNEDIAEQVENDDYTLACKIGGDEANLATWAGWARKALRLSLQRPRLALAPDRATSPTST